MAARRGAEPSSAGGARRLGATGAEGQELGAECGLCADDLGHARDPHERSRWSPMECGVRSPLWSGAGVNGPTAVWFEREHESL